MSIARNWLPAITGMSCLGLGAGLIGIYGFFIQPLSEEFGVGVATLNIAPVALLLVPGFVAPFVGRLADRLPVRRLVLTGVTLAMLSLVAASRAPSLALAALGFLGFSLGLTMYGPVVVNGLMVKLYPGREARALAVAAIGISIATAILPPLAGMLLAHFDWRSTLLLIACSLLAVLWLVVLAGFPGGVVGTPPSPGDAASGRDFYREPAFWLIGICVAMGMNVAMVLAVCYPPHFVNEGYSVAQAGWFLSLAGLAGLTGKALLAWLGDAVRLHAKWLAAGVLLLQVAGLVLLLRTDGAPGVMAALAIMGFGGGAFLPIQPYLNSRYFDTAIISHVNGAQMPLFLPLGLVGAPLAGYTFDSTGSYELVLQVLAVTLFIAALLAARLPAPRR
jgi:predicted MFS family arabinose efflux permease